MRVTWIGKRFVFIGYNGAGFSFPYLSPVFVFVRGDAGKWEVLVWPVWVFPSIYLYSVLNGSGGGDDGGYVYCRV